jgi:hypothetical protein
MSSQALILDKLAEEPVLVSLPEGRHVSGRAGRLPIPLINREKL